MFHNMKRVNSDDPDEYIRGQRTIPRIVVHPYWRQLPHILQERPVALRGEARVYAAVLNALSKCVTGNYREPKPIVYDALARADGMRRVWCRKKKEMRHGTNGTPSGSLQGVSEGSACDEG